MTYSSGTALRTVLGVVLTRISIVFGNSLHLDITKVVLWSISSIFLILDPVVFLQNREYKEILKKSFKEIKTKIAAKFASV